MSQTSSVLNRSSDRLNSGGSTPWLGGKGLVFLILAGIGLPGISACSSFVSDVRLFQTGWRTAEVTEVGSAAEIKSRGMTDCRATATADQLASSRFAAVTYSMNRHRHAHIVIVDDRSVVVRGDTVFTNVLRCGTPLEVRPSRAAGGS